MGDFKLEVPSGPLGKYLFFCFDNDVSCGGMDDCKGYFNNKEEFLNLLSEHNDYDHYQLLNLVSGCKVSFIYDDITSEDWERLSRTLMSMLDYCDKIGA